jgi:hypothetical protein
MYIYSSSSSSLDNPHYIPRLSSWFFSCSLFVFYRSLVRSSPSCPAVWFLSSKQRYLFSYTIFLWIGAGLGILRNRVSKWNWTNPQTYFKKCNIILRLLLLLPARRWKPADIVHMLEGHHLVSEFCLTFIFIHYSQYCLLLLMDGWMNLMEDDNVFHYRELASFLYKFNYYYY